VKLDFKSEPERDIETKMGKTLLAEQIQSPSINSGNYMNLGTREQYSFICEIRGWGSPSTEPNQTKKQLSWQV